MKGNELRAWGKGKMNEFGSRNAEIGKKERPGAKGQEKRAEGRGLRSNYSAFPIRFLPHAPCAPRYAQSF